MHRPATCADLPGPPIHDVTGCSDRLASPVVVRLSGLPAQAIEPLTSSACRALLDARRSIEEELGEARGALAEAIGNALPGFAAAARRFLLTVKRSCFNGREIRMLRGKPEWTELALVSPHLPERIVTLEEQLLDNDRAFTAVYQRELARERRHVLGLLEDHRFLRGVALGRPGLAQKVRAKSPSLLASEALKTRAKWEQSLLRFAVRAATKLSANSTLTAYTLGSVQDSPSWTGFRFAGSPQREVSLVRANRPELEQLQEVLMLHPSVRERAIVAWNDSLEELTPGQYRFLRGARWDLAPAATEFHLVRPARITVQLDNPLLNAARDALREGALRYDALWALLKDRNGGPAADPELRIDLDQLVDLGVLLLMPPWPAQEARLEQRIARFLRDLTDEPMLRRATEALNELVAFEEGFAAAPRPETSIAHMEEAFSRLLHAVLPLSGCEGPLTTRANFFEDVLFVPLASSDPGQETFQIASPEVQGILRSAGLVARFAGLFNHRHDVLHTLAAWWRQQEPSRREMPFTELAQGFGDLWKQFLHFNKTANQSALSRFAPLPTPALDALRESRESLLANARRSLEASPEKDLLPAPRLAELLHPLPHRYAPLLGSCVFVQPMDGAGDGWVLNRLHEGTGRYLSRLTPVLEEPLQRRFLDHLIARSCVDLEGEEADLLEVMQPWGSLVNAHPPQAAKVLDLRGLHLDLPRERRVGLGDLRVQADLDAETFRLIDGSGRRMLPVHLSSMADSGLPPLLRLLLTFGPGETRGILPFAHSEGDEGLRSFRRLTCGKLVLRRRRWTIRIEELRIRLEGLAEPRAYSAIHDWRSRLALPATGFYYERTYHGTIKPQYVAFDSPSLCSLFISSLLRTTARHLVFEEALPSPADFPLDGSSHRRGCELLIDSLALRTLHGNSSAGAADRDRESVSLGKDGRNA